MEKRGKNHELDKVMKHQGKTGRKPEAEKRQNNEPQSALIALLRSLEGKRAVLTVPLGKGKGNEGEI